MSIRDRIQYLKKRVKYSSQIHRVEVILKIELKKPYAGQDIDLIKECLETLEYLNRAALNLDDEKVSRQVPKHRSLIRLVPICIIMLLFVSACAMQVFGVRFWTLNFKWNPENTQIDYVPNLNTPLLTGIDESDLWSKETPSGEDELTNWVEFESVEDALTTMGISPIVLEGMNVKYVKGYRSDTSGGLSIIYEADEGLICYDITFTNEHSTASVGASGEANEVKPYHNPYGLEVDIISAGDRLIVTFTEGCFIYLFETKLPYEIVIEIVDNIH